MNPIVIIGLVAVITAGIYATYDGLQKQAELAALHADMLSRQHVAHTVYVDGTVIISSDPASNQTDIIITNNGLRPVDLIQIRMYNSTAGGIPSTPEINSTSLTTPAALPAATASGLIRVWHTDYALPPLRSLNLTDTPLGGSAPELSGAPLREIFTNTTDTANRITLRGVTSGGSIFDIDDTALNAALLRQNLAEQQALLGGSGNGTGLGGAFTNLAVIVPDGGFASESGSDTTYDYYFEAGITTCTRTTGALSYTVHTVWDRRDIYDVPSHRGTGLPAGLTSAAPSTPSTGINYLWEYKQEYGRYHAPPYPQCDPADFHGRFPTPSVNPPDITRHPDRPNVWYRLASAPDWSVSAAVPIAGGNTTLAGNLTAPADGTILIRVEAPVVARATASAAGSFSYSELYVNYRCDAVSLPSATRASYDAALGSHLRSLAQSETARLTLGVGFEINGVPAAVSMRPAATALDGTVSATPSGTPTHTVTLDGSSTHCTKSIDLHSDYAAIHTGVATGLAKIPVSQGDTVSLDGRIRVDYAPSLSGTVTASYAELTVSNPLVMVGFAPKVG